MQIGTVGNRSRGIAFTHIYSGMINKESHREKKKSRGNEHTATTNSGSRFTFGGRRKVGAEPTAMSLKQGNHQIALFIRNQQRVGASRNLRLGTRPMQ